MQFKPMLFEGQLYCESTCKLWSIHTWNFFWSISTCKSAKPGCWADFGAMHAYGGDNGLTKHSICSSMFPSPFAVRLGHVIVLTRKLRAQVTCVTFRPKCGGAGTMWSSGCVSSYHGDWVADVTATRWQKQLPSGWIPEGWCGVQHHHQLVMDMYSEQETNLCVKPLEDYYGIICSCNASILSSIKWCSKSKNLEIFT